MPVLEDLAAAYFEQRTPIIAIVCSDWKRRYEMIQHLATLRGFSRDEDPRVHMFAWHAGPLRLHPESPTNKPHDHEVFENELEEAIKFTGFLDIALLKHWPCLKCLDARMEVDQAWRLMLEVSSRVQEKILGARCRTIFHADYADLKAGEMRSYRLHPGRCAGLITAA